MKKLIPFCFGLICLAFSAQSFGQAVLNDKVNIRARTLIQRIKQRQSVKSVVPLLQFYLSPENPVQNQNVSLIARPSSTFTGREISLDAKLEGADIELDRPSKTMWILPLGALPEAKEYQASYSIFIENTQENIDIRNSITALEHDISVLTNQIKNERDPVRRKNLQEQRDEKSALKNELIEQLKKYRTKAGAQNFKFTVKTAPNDSNLPKITTVSPSIGSVAGGLLVTITGSNFQPDAIVKFGSLVAETTFIDGNTLKVKTPVFSGEGIQDLEIRQTNAGKIENTILQSAFYASANSTVRNLKPVAITNGYQEVVISSGIQLDGSQSYDENGDIFSFSWTLLAKPTDSSKVIGSEVGTASIVGFTPDLPGTYVFQLVTKETDTADLFSSAPSFATVLVKSAAPINHAPAPTAPSINVLSGNTATSQVSVNDSDVGQTAAFALVQNPTSGTASVSASGLVTYTASSAFVGADSVVVRVTDNGSPALSGDVTIPIQVTTDNHAPAPTADNIVTHTEAALVTIFANDPDSSQTQTYSVLTQAAHGNAYSPADNNVFQYASEAGFIGQDSFVVRVQDNGVPSLSGDVTVNVTVSPNTEPTFQIGPINVITGTTYSAQISVVDPDPNQSGTYDAFAPSHGTSSITQAGVFTYTPEVGYVGSDAFGVIYIDNGNPTLYHSEIVAVQVLGYPTATSGAISSKGQTASTQISATNPNLGHGLNYAVQSAGSGSVFVTADGLVSYTPADGFVGSDTITIRVSDSSVSALYFDLSISVTVAVNHAPAPTAPGISAGKNGTATTQISPNDPDGQALVYAIVTPPTNGTATVSSTGLVSFTGTTDYVGADSIVISVSDNGHPALSGTVTIAVNVVSNFPPVLVGPIFARQKIQGFPYQWRLSLGVPLNAVTDPDGTITTMWWDFGDGTRERTLDKNSSFIFHNYMATGTFHVTYTATDNSGASSTLERDIVVNENDVPVAKFKVSPLSGTFPLTVTFDSTESSDADGITAYRWLWPSTPGNLEEVTTNPVITHTFNSPGTFSIRHRVNDPSGAEGEASISLFLGTTSGSTTLVPAALVGPPREVLVGSPVMFDGSRSFNPIVGQSLVNYHWNFSGNGTCAGCSADSLTASYTFAGPFAYNQFPFLKVTSSDGRVSGPTMQEVSIVNAGHAPRAVPRFDKISGVAPLTVRLDCSESYDYDGVISNTTWNFGDNSPPVSAAVVSHTYSNAGFYTASCQVQDNDFNNVQVFQSITVTSAASTAFPKEQRKKLDLPPNEDREYQRQLLTGACAQGSGDACFELGKMYSEDGDEFSKTKLWEKACGLGYAEACSSSSDSPWTKALRKMFNQ